MLIVVSLQCGIICNFIFFFNFQISFSKNAFIKRKNIYIYIILKNWLSKSLNSVDYVQIPTQRICKEGTGAVGGRCVAGHISVTRTPLWQARVNRLHLSDLWEGCGCDSGGLAMLGSRSRWYKLPLSFGLPVLAIAYLKLLPTE